MLRKSTRRESFERRLRDSKSDNKSEMTESWYLESLRSETSVAGNSEITASEINEGHVSNMDLSNCADRITNTGECASFNRRHDKSKIC